MKKVLALLLIAVMCCGVFAACSSPAAETPSEPTTTEETPATTEDADAASLVSDAFINPTADWTQYNDLITQIKTETDYAKRTELMHQAEDILMSNYCILPFYYYNDLYMQKDYVDGIYANLFQTKFFMYATMSNGSDTLRLNLASEPDFLDPALNSTVDGACLAANSFSGLYTYNAEGHTVPACATGYTVSDDGLTYTVTLREGLKWSDGSDLTAADFEYAWKRAAATATAADYGYMFAGFAGYPDELNVTAKDATTFEFVLTAPCAYIEDLMAFPTFYPVKQAAVEAYKDWQTSPGGWCQDAGFVSNGAYVCTEWNHDTSMTYEKNPYWYDADKVTVNKLQFMLSADDTAIYSAYNAGDVDFIDTVPTNEIASLKDVNPEFHIIDALGTYYAAFNCKSALFADKTPEQAACMREAFSILIDRDYIIENVAQCGQKPANSFIPYGMADGKPLRLSDLRTEKDWLRVRGREIAMVMQDPMTSLNPLKTIGAQIMEAVALHQGLKGAAAKEKTLEYLRDVGITDPEKRFKQYPHEFSGGMRQRVVIAIAVACSPKILICDEPTTALDVTIQAQILQLLKEMRFKYDLTIVMITHDSGIALEAKRVVRISDGKINFDGDVKDYAAIL